MVEFGGAAGGDGRIQTCSGGLSPIVTVGGGDWAGGGRKVSFLSAGGAERSVRWRGQHRRCGTVAKSEPWFKRKQET